ncbi:2-succinyl-5-enolpyruvyl-6-hydroxy-3-cyclohexene-1-carboxylic-acid synthase [Nocardioides sp. GY 10127]|uniref:2-succinyl-5-enolpyruvyl-6-hydroxy-3- cyclohexene-1-carboxylic-acid synthase n=1 Tax=Nocardioides sp. GY 10127 TaxID=2569762 RepID=UPI0010A85723|nr:2-succinyl-5-enolpyruvyl-6-hydroxy-3-cyclohexene-1-carboxylic-acid synthase [Nocardioides sp. GY 10127]TIC80105.1 2-succinyl-5-enolpyruvyl-6-hydroxy-3-cyclohexene-1-carboxylic-acid synthase [Nocardioides sp. GY 10127]
MTAHPDPAEPADAADTADPTEPGAVLAARAVLAALVRAGVREVVLSPGSRNAPLALALVDADRAGVLRLHTRLDERSAGFTALGLARTGPPAAVVCTSGTAVANLHPAVLEAAHAGVRLVALTADRPARLRGTSANQTTEQEGIFGRLVPTLDLDASAGLPVPLELSVAGGPLHLNLRLDAPLVPHAPWPPADLAALAAVPASPPPPVVPPGSLPLLDPAPRTVVVAGDDAGPWARILAERAGWPLLAEPSSGARTGTHAIRTYRLLLAGPLGAQVERVVVAGNPTLSRPVSALLERPGLEVLAGPLRGAWTTRPHPVAGVLEPARPHPDQPTSDPAWLEAWRAADADVSRRLDALLAAEDGITPHEVAGAVGAALPAGGLLVLGPSNPVRDLDLMVPRYRVGDRRKVIANRGLAGIDGIVSTAIGASLGRDSSRALALLGDVTFLHDAGGLVLGPREPRPDLTLVVVNDDGGSIFATLEQGAPAYADSFERAFATPHGADLAALCAATRTPHWRVESLPELHQALASPNGGLEVVEVRVGRADRRELDARIRALATDA